MLLSHLTQYFSEVITDKRFSVLAGVNIFMPVLACVENKDQSAELIGCLRVQKKNVTEVARGTQRQSSPLVGTNLFGQLFTKCVGGCLLS